MRTQKSAKWWSFRTLYVEVYPSRALPLNKICLSFRTLYVEVYLFSNIERKIDYDVSVHYMLRFIKK